MSFELEKVGSDVKHNVYKVARSIDAFHRGFTCRSTFHFLKIPFLSLSKLNCFIGKQLKK